MNKDNCYYYFLHVHDPESAIGKVLPSAKIGLKAIITIFSSPHTTVLALFLENVKPFLGSQNTLIFWWNASITGMATWRSTLVN